MRWQSGAIKQILDRDKIDFIQVTFIFIWCHCIWCLVNTFAWCLDLWSILKHCTCIILNPNIWVFLKLCIPGELFAVINCVRPCYKLIWPFHHLFSICSLLKPSLLMIIDNFLMEWVKFITECHCLQFSTSFVSLEAMLTSILLDKFPEFDG